MKTQNLKRGRRNGDNAEAGARNAEAGNRDAECGTQNPEWMTVRLSDVVEIDRNGVDPTKLNPSEQYLGLEHLDAEGNITYDQTIGSSGVRSSKFRFTQKHILFGKLRPYLRKVAKPSHEGVCSTDILPLLPNEGYDRNFLFHLLRTDDTIQRATQACAGANLPRLSPAKFRVFEFRVPRSIVEQKRIAAILDKADAIRRKRRQALQLTDNFLRSLFLDMFGDPVTNPKGWDTERLQDVILPIDSGSSPVCHNYPASEDEWGILKLGCVTKCKYLPNENKALPEDVTPNAQNEVKAGDLLFSRKNTHDLVAAAAFVFETRSKLLLPDLIFRITPKPEANLCNEFLWQQLLHPHLRQKIQSLAGGAAGSMPNISKSKLGDTTIITPPEALQNHFAAICHAWWSKYKRAQQLSLMSNNFFASLQQRAFKGEV